MKILITTGIFWPEFGGPATVAAELASRLNTAGHQVEVITYSGKQQYPEDASLVYPIKRVMRKQNKLFNYISYFIAVFKESRKFDFIYSLDWFSAGVPAMIAAYMRRKKYIVRIGGGYIWEKYLAEGRPPVTLKQFYEKGLHKEYRVMFFLIKRVLKNAHTVIFNSEEQKNLYIKYYKLDPHKVAVILNALPEHKFGLLVESYKIRSSERDKEFVFWGRFIKMKNVESLIKAFAKLKDPEFRLVLIGSGPTEAILKDTVKKEGLEGRVAFEPPMNHKELFRRIANCYCVVFPSWTDVSPHQAYECLALKIPFLITKENYLSINKEDFLKVDPTSVDDIAEKMNYILDENHYADFTDSLSKIKFRKPWSEVLADHIKVFKTLYESN